MKLEKIFKAAEQIISMVNEKSQLRLLSNKIMGEFHHLLIIKDILEKIQNAHNEAFIESSIKKIITILKKDQRVESRFEKAYEKTKPILDSYLKVGKLTHDKHVEKLEALLKQVQLVRQQLLTEFGSNNLGIKAKGELLKLANIKQSADLLRQINKTISENQLLSKDFNEIKSIIHEEVVPTNALLDADLDGIVCGAILKKIFPTIKTFQFGAPKAIKNGVFSDFGKVIKIPKGTIVADLPYVNGSLMWFDHHAGCTEYEQEAPGERKQTPSCARLVANHFNFTEFEELLDETDRLDHHGASLADDENPKGVYLLYKAIDADWFKPNAQEINSKIINALYQGGLNKALSDKKVKRNYEYFLNNSGSVIESIKKSIVPTNDNIMIMDLRGAKIDDPSVSRVFKDIHYNIAPNKNVSIKIYYENKEHTQIKFQLGKSLINRTSKINIGDILVDGKVHYKKLYNAGGGSGAGGLTLDFSKFRKWYISNNKTELKSLDSHGRSAKLEEAWKEEYNNAYKYLIDNLQN